MFFQRFSEVMTFFASWFSIWLYVCVGKWHEKTENAVLHEIKLREASIQPLVFDTVIDINLSTLLCIQTENVLAEPTVEFHYWKLKIVNLLTWRYSQNFWQWLYTHGYLLLLQQTPIICLRVESVHIYYLLFPKCRKHFTDLSHIFWYHIKCFL